MNLVSYDELISQKNLSTNNISLHILKFHNIIPFFFNFNNFGEVCLIKNILILSLSVNMMIILENCAYFTVEFLKYQFETIFLLQNIK